MLAAVVGPEFPAGAKATVHDATLSADDTADYDTRIRPKLRGPTNPVSRGTVGSALPKPVPASPRPLRATRSSPERRFVTQGHTLRLASLTLAQNGALESTAKLAIRPAFARSSVRRNQGAVAAKLAVITLATVQGYRLGSDVYEARDRLDKA